MSQYLYNYTLVDYLINNSNTVGVDYRSYTRLLSDGSKMRIDFWDTVIIFKLKAGSERFRSIIPIAIKDA